MSDPLENVMPVPDPEGGGFIVRVREMCEALEKFRAIVNDAAPARPRSVTVFFDREVELRFDAEAGDA